MPTRCPCCGHQVSPVYCAASTPEQQRLLAYSVEQAEAALGLSDRALYARIERWGDGWRIVPQRDLACRYCGERRIWRRSALANHEARCERNPQRRAA